MGTLFVTQFRDIVRNSQLVVFWMTLVGVALVMRYVSPKEASGIVAGVMLVMPAYFVGWNIPAMTLAEEKEKRVLQGLLTTPLQLGQVLAVKGILSLALSLFFTWVVVLISGDRPANPAVLLLGSLLLTLFTIGCGTLVGLLVKDLKQVATLGTPVVLVLIFASTLPWEQFRPEVWAAQGFLPTRPAAELLRAGMYGIAGPTLQNCLVMLLYSGLVLALVAWRARRMSQTSR